MSAQEITFRIVFGLVVPLACIALGRCHRVLLERKRSHRKEKHLTP